MSTNITKTNKFYIVKDQAVLAIPAHQYPSPNKQVLVETRDNYGAVQKKYSTVIDMTKVITNSNPITGVNLRKNIQCECQQGYIFDQVEAFLRLASRFINLGSASPYSDVITVYNRDNSILFSVGIHFYTPENSKYTKLGYQIASKNKSNESKIIARGQIEKTDGFIGRDSIYTLSNGDMYEQLYHTGNLYYSSSIDTGPYLRILMKTAIENGQYKLFITLQTVIPVLYYSGIWLPYTSQTYQYDTTTKASKQFYKVNETTDLTQITAADERWYRRWMRNSSINNSGTVQMVSNREIEALKIDDLASAAPYKVSLFNNITGQQLNDLVYNPSLFVRTRPLPKSTN